MPKAIALPSQAELKDAFDYKDGSLFFKHRPVSDFGNFRLYRAFCGRYVGKRAGHLNTEGYIHVRYKGKLYLAHRLIWVWNLGEIPDGFEVDHEDGVRDNNLLSNLKAVPAGVNCLNAKARSDNKSGMAGVHKRTNSRTWFAQCGLKGVVHYLGSFDTFDDAAGAVKNFHRENGFSERHGV